ncbi:MULTISPECIES: lipopolysaccharide kinase InaA family protein [unclassified Nocardiopsis]|uniref:protein kinase domain-containing protein n=1 Tax=unclassified Nocardiopsis TaxID=2649073 RepID=UPI0013596B48|nr:MULTISPECIES: lipopolysaccharide kinase InaA family protein [unclassified Nocardiopsis]
MKLGDVINGYRIVTEPTNAGGGKCMWAFAERDGREYFVKRFLDPKRPRPSPEPPSRSVRVRLQACEEFEERHLRIMEALRPDQAGGGNLVLAQDFFCEGSTYYKVTERIDTSNMESPHTLGAREKSVLLKTLGQSLRQLHDIDVVHGDLKPDNVLVQRQTVFHTAKLIDFDDAYISGNPPGHEEIAGDALYGSPEWQRYVRGEEGCGPQTLTTASDIFALGLLTHLYLTGALPAYPDGYGSPAEAVNAGAALEFDPRLAPGTRALVSRMCAAMPDQRPGAGAFVSALTPDACALEPTAVSETPAGPAPEASSSGSRLRTNLTGAAPAGGAGGDKRAKPGAERRSRVRINWS